MTVHELRARSRVAPSGRPLRVAVLSVHTSPLDQPGTGDAGGMNVYVLETARRLAELGTQVDVFTRATSSAQPPVVQAAPGVLVRHVVAGPYEGLPKEDLPAQLCAFATGVLRAGAGHEPGWYDLVHSHYWLSGHVGWLATERWGLPLVHSMHTMARVKNAALAVGDEPEPRARVIGEQQVVDIADRLVAGTRAEAAQLVDLYAADPAKVDVVPPGVDLERFAPGDRSAAREVLGLPADSLVVLFAGRIQPLKAPDLLLTATAVLVGRDPPLRDRLVVAVVGGPSGRGADRAADLRDQARQLGIADLVRFTPAVSQESLADWYRAADLTAVPSYNESFGLVAMESQACGTPVVAAAVGGLETAVADGRSGLLVPGHDPGEWAQAIRAVLLDPVRARALSAGARSYALGFGWEDTARRLLDVYRASLDVAASPGPGVAVR